MLCKKNFKAFDTEEEKDLVSFIVSSRVLVLI